MKDTYTAVVKKSDDWWIGWIEEVPGVNCQESSQGQSCEGWSEGNPSAKVRADDKIVGNDFEHPQDGPEGVSLREEANNRNRIEGSVSIF